MKRIIIISITLLVSSMIGRAQSAKGSLINVPKESVYLQYNESLLFSGEHLMYKLYCINKSTKQASDLSKIGYVVLVDQQGTSVFTHKVRLTDGSGYGDFFIPTSVPTGSYKLLGYSEWMKNFGTESFFQSDVHIINPYQVTSESFLEPRLDSLQEASAMQTVRNTGSKAPSKIASPFLTLSLDKSEVGKREKVVAHITALNMVVEQGDYAISIRKKDSIPAPERISTHAFFSDYVLKGPNKMEAGSNIMYLPELRGEVISGTIVKKEGGQPAEGKRISLSLPGDKFLLKIATSDANGRFKFITEREYDNVKAALQILSNDWDQYEVALDSHDLNKMDLNHTDFKLSKKMKDYILQKSIQNQIENAYREQRSDSILPASHIAPYYRKFTENHDLDDYTRFNSIDETIVEVVDQVSIRRLDNGDRVFEIRPREGFTDLSMLPMVFVDGLFIKRHENFMDFSAKKIKTISFSREKIMLGSQSFQGVLFFKTIDGSFYNDFYAPHVQNVTLFKPQPQKDYFDQAYLENGQQDRIPDFRYQLLWEPNLELSSGKKEIVFYTSDVAGEYELVVEGFTSTGNPVSVKERFMVK